MIHVSQILFLRLVKNEKNYSVFLKEFNLTKSEFDTKFKSISKIKDFFSDELIVKAYKLFESKINNDKKIYKWNLKNREKKTKQYCFSSYSRIDENGRSVKSKENFKDFYSDIKSQYTAQSKAHLQLSLPWIRDNLYIKSEECVCFYCGINESILKELYIDPNYMCKTKRNRGGWFELDRCDSAQDANVYSKYNMVFCCYFCNNLKSDVVSSFEMRLFFGEKMFQFLVNKYLSILKTRESKTCITFM